MCYFCAFLWSSLSPTGPSRRVRTHPSAVWSTLKTYRQGTIFSTRIKSNSKKNSFGVWKEILQMILCHLAKNTFCSVPPCSSSGVSLWPTKDSEKKLLEKEESSWKCYDQPSLTEEVNSSDSSSMSFSGPYIFCQVRYPQSQSGSSVRCPGAESFTTIQCESEIHHLTQNFI